MWWLSFVLLVLPRVEYIAHVRVHMSVMYAVALFVACSRRLSSILPILTVYVYCTARCRCRIVEQARGWTYIPYCTVPWKAPGVAKCVSRERFRAPPSNALRTSNAPYCAHLTQYNLCMLADAFVGGVHVTTFQFVATYSVKHFSRWGNALSERVFLLLRQHFLYLLPSPSRFSFAHPTAFTSCYFCWTVPLAFPLLQGCCIPLEGRYAVWNPKSKNTITIADGLSNLCIRFLCFERMATAVSSAVTQTHV